MKIGITIDSWKLAIFEKKLKQAEFSFVTENKGKRKSILLTIDPKDLDRLAKAAHIAEVEAIQSTQQIYPNNTLSLEVMIGKYTLC